jgi:hypothetical protein
MIAGRCRNDPMLADPGKFGLNLERCAANLERAGYLQILQLEIDLETGYSAQSGRIYERRSDNDALDDFVRPFDPRKRNHFSSPRKCELILNLVSRAQITPAALAG